MSIVFSPKIFKKKLKQAYSAKLSEWKKYWLSGYLRFYVPVNWVHWDAKPKRSGRDIRFYVPVKKDGT